MGKLFHFELYKLPRQRSFWICAGITAGLTILSALATQAMLLLLQSESGLLIEGPMGGWDYMTGVVSNGELTVLTAIFVSIFVSSDSSGNTLKNVCARGYSRDCIYFAKYLAALIGTLLMFALDALVSLLIGSALWGFGPVDGSLLTVLYLLVIYVCYFTLFFFVSILIGRIGASVAINVAGPILLSALFSILDILLRDVTVSDYWFSHFFNVPRDAAASPGELGLALGLSALYGSLALIGGWLLFRRKEI